VSETVPPVSRLLDLTGRIALVTEASGGVGSGIAQRFAEAGAAVVVHYRSDARGATAVVATRRPSAASTTTSSPAARSSCGRRCSGSDSTRRAGCLTIATGSRAPGRTKATRRRTADGDEIELITRLASFGPLEQRHELEMRARLWHAGAVVREESFALSENLYFAPEIVLLLEAAGFREIELEAAYENRPPTADDDTPDRHRPSLKGWSRRYWVR
jgi:hypothetical protein